MQKKAGLDDETIQNARIYEAHGSKIYKELHEDYSVASITEYVTLYAEMIPDEEQSAEEGDRAIYAFHYDKESNKPHGVPFKFLVRPVSKVGRCNVALAHERRVNSLRIPRNVYPSVPASKGSNSRKSSSQWFTGAHTQSRRISRMVGIFLTWPWIQRRGEANGLQMTS